jgi:hypothetical protein
MKVNRMTKKSVPPCRRDTGTLFMPRKTGAGRVNLRWRGSAVRVGLQSFQKVRRAGTRYRIHIIDPFLVLLSPANLALS